MNDVLFIYVNLEEKPTINLCLKSMCLLLFTSHAHYYVKEQSHVQFP